MAGKKVVLEDGRSDRWLIEPPWDQWILAGVHGHQFGPVTQGELEQWCTEGRLNNRMNLLRIDWDDWRRAGDVYPELTFESHRSANRPIPIGELPEETLQPETDEEPAEDMSMDEVVVVGDATTGPVDHDEAVVIGDSPGPTVAADEFNIGDSDTKPAAEETDGLPEIEI